MIRRHVVIVVGLLTLAAALVCGHVMQAGADRIAEKADRLHVEADSAVWLTEADAVEELRGYCAEFWTAEDRWQRITLAHFVVSYRRCLGDRCPAELSEEVDRILAQYADDETR